jgi:hypothetical protein
MGRRHFPLKAEGIFGQSNQDKKGSLTISANLINLCINNNLKALKTVR